MPRDSLLVLPLSVPLPHRVSDLQHYVGSSTDFIDLVSTRSTHPPSIHIFYRITPHYASTYYTFVLAANLSFLYLQAP